MTADPTRSLMERYARVLESSDSSVNPRSLEARVHDTLRRRAGERARSVERFRAAALGAAALALVGSLVAFQLGESRGRASVSATRVDAGEWLTSREGAPSTTKFADGSALTLEGDSRARVQFLEKTGGLVHLDSGRVRLEVQHHDGSSWRVAAGPYEVEAVGTDFSVDWSSNRAKPLRVNVSEGKVLVRGPALAMGRFVSAHQSFEIEQTAPLEVVATPAPSVSGLDVELDPNDHAGSSPAVPRGQDASWRALEAAGKYPEAIRAAEGRGLSGIYASASPDELLGLARAGRLSGRVDIAREALLACRQRFAGSKQAAMAAFLLGRASSAQQAAHWFSTYLEEQPDGSLAREALGRLIEASVQSGDRPGARVAATRYLKSHPQGPHAALARDVLAR